MPPTLKHFALPLTVATCAIAVALLGHGADAALRYDRAALLGGDWWRLLTAHLVHLGWSHLALNLAGLAVIWLLVGQLLSVGQWIGVMVVCGLGVSGGLLVFDPQLAWYVGLSGVLHGMLTSACLIDIRAGRRSTWLVLAAVCAKLLWEQVTGPLPGSVAAAGGAVIVDAHLYGALAGIVVGAALSMRHRPGALSGGT